MYFNYVTFTDRIIIVYLISTLKTLLWQLWNCLITPLLLLLVSHMYIILLYWLVFHFLSAWKENLKLVLIHVRKQCVFREQARKITNYNHCSLAWHMLPVLAPMTSHSTSSATQNRPHKHSALSLVRLMFAHMHNLYRSFHVVCTLKYLQLHERGGGLMQSIMLAKSRVTKMALFHWACKLRLVWRCVNLLQSRCWRSRLHAVSGHASQHHNNFRV